jgi:hypothetical protein
VPLLILAVWIGIYPKPFIDRLQTSVDRVVVRISPEYRAGRGSEVPVPGSALANQELGAGNPEQRGAR